MITINLLPVKETKRRRQMILFFYAGFLLLGVVAIMGWFWWVQYQKVGELKYQIAKVEEESKGYEEKIKEVKDLQAKEASLEVFRDVIKSVYDQQKLILAALDQLALDLGENMRLIAIDRKSGADSKSLTIKGSAMTQADIQQYVNRLRRPGGAVSNPKVEDLTTRQTVSVMNSFVYNFTLKVNLGGAP
jgi:Tfp pilus assembly protein PilN